MSTYDFSSSNPYEVLGLTPGSATITAAQAAYVNAAAAAGGDFDKRLAAKDAFHKVQTDIRLVGEGLPSAYAPTVQVQPVAAAVGAPYPVAGYVDPVAAQIAANRVQIEQLREQIDARRGAQGASWGPTVTGDVYDAGAGVPLGAGNPAEKRVAPGFASREFFDWQQEFNQAEFLVNAYPKGKVNIFLAFVLGAAGALGVLYSFWMIVAGVGLTGMASWAEENGGLEPGAWTSADYSTFTVVMCLVLMLSVAVFFSPLILRARNRRSVRTKYENLYRLGLANGWF